MFYFRQLELVEGGTGTMSNLTHKSAHPVNGARNEIGSLAGCGQRSHHLHIEAVYLGGAGGNRCLWEGLGATRGLKHKQVNIIQYNYRYATAPQRQHTDYRFSAPSRNVTGFPTLLSYALPRTPAPGAPHDTSSARCLGDASYRVPALAPAVREVARHRVDDGLRDPASRRVEHECALERRRQAGVRARVCRRALEH